MRSLLAEHGGGATDDTQVAFLISVAGAEPGQVAELWPRALPMRPSPPHRRQGSPSMGPSMGRHLRRDQSVRSHAGSLAPIRPLRTRIVGAQLCTPPQVVSTRAFD